MESDKEDIISVENLIATAREKAIKKILDKVAEKEAARFDRFVPILLDYYGGMPLQAIYKKHNIDTKRNEFYHFLKDMGLPTLSQTTLKKALHQVKTVQRSEDRLKIQSQINNCNCLTCKWLAGRLKHESHIL